MTNARATILVMAVVLSLASSPVLALVEFKDGGIHDIDYEINDDVRVDHLAPAMQTTVNLLAGGTIPYPYNLQAFEDSRINILGGSIGWYLDAYDSSQINISGGWINEALGTHDNSQVHMSAGTVNSWLYAWGSSQIDISGGSVGAAVSALDNSQVDISGGSIGWWVNAWGSSQVDIFGGSIGHELTSDDSAILTIHGSDFAVDGAPFGYGELTSILGGSPWDEPSRHLTGTLASGEPIGNDFYISHDGKIVLIPAPGALVLGAMGLGLVGWLRRRRTL